MRPSVPVYVGLAGPTSPLALMKFAQLCGVSASSARALGEGIGAARLVTHTDPSEQLAAIAHHISASASNIVGVHLYTFGGVTKAAQWMNEMLRNTDARKV